MPDTRQETATVTEAPLSTIARIRERDGQTVTLHGWLYNLRASGKLLFSIFRDGTGTIQGIVPKAAVSPEVFEDRRGSHPRVLCHRYRQSPRRSTCSGWLRIQRRERPGPAACLRR